MNKSRVPKGNQTNDTKLFMAIVDALKQSPAYLLVFSVIVLTYMFSIAVLGIGVKEGGVGDLQLYSLGGLVLETIIVVVLEGQKARRASIDELEEQRARDRQQIDELERVVESADRSDINIENEEARKCLAAIVDDVRQGLGFANPIFHSEVFYQLNDFKTRTSSRWAEGVLHTDAGNYDRILRSFYRNARHSVFATTNEEYMSFWARPETAEQVLNAHRDAFRTNGARVTRVFVFASAANITPDHVRVIKLQAKEPFITTRIFLAEDNPNIAFSEQLVNDFVMIDQKRPEHAIGITSSFDPDQMGAKWIFGRDTRIEQTAQWIEDGSITVTQLETRIRGAARRG